MTPASRNKKAMNQEYVNEIQDSWIDLISRPSLPAGEVRIDITNFMTEEEVAQLNELLPDLEENDKIVQNATKFLASFWLDRIKANGRIRNEESMAEALNEGGFNWKGTKSQGQVASLKKLAGLIGLNPKEEFWPDLKNWVRRVFGYAKLWFTQLEKNDSKLPADLFYIAEGTRFLKDMKKLNEPEHESLPALITNGKTIEGNWILLSHDPLKIMKVYTGDSVERLEEQKKVLREIVEIVEFKQELATLIRAYVNDNLQGANGQKWTELKEVFTNARGENMKVIVPEHENKLWTNMGRNLERIMSAINDQHKEIEKARLRTIVGWAHVTTSSLNFEEIPSPPGDRVIPKDITTDIHRSQTHVLFKAPHTQGNFRIL